MIYFHLIFILGGKNCRSTGRRGKGEARALSTSFLKNQIQYEHTSIEIALCMIHSLISESESDKRFRPKGHFLPMEERWLFLNFSFP